MAWLPHQRKNSTTTTPLPSLPLLHGETQPGLAESAPGQVKEETLHQRCCSRVLPRLLIKVASHGGEGGGGGGMV